MGIGGCFEFFRGYFVFSHGNLDPRSVVEKRGNPVTNSIQQGYLSYAQGNSGESEWEGSRHPVGGIAAA